MLVVSLDSFHDFQTYIPEKTVADLVHQARQQEVKCVAQTLFVSVSDFFVPKLVDCECKENQDACIHNLSHQPSNLLIVF